jgi:DNA-binding response OmpR family regulator
VSYVVLVETNTMLAFVTGSMILAAGHPVLLARTSRHARETLSGLPRPSLVFADLGSDPGATMSEIRGLPGWEQVPIVGLTSRRSEEQRQLALDSGATDYLEKPFHSSERLREILAQLRPIGNAGV